MSILCDQVNHLIAKIKKGDKDAFEKLYKLTYHHLTYVVFNYTYDREDVNDIIQETYFRAMLYIHSADTSKDSYNWLCKIAQNVAYDFNRNKGVTVPYSLVEQKRLFYEISDAKIEVSLLNETIKKFDPFDQRLFYLKFFEDKTYEDISKITGMKKPIVYKRIQTMLRKIDKDYHDE